MPDTITTAEAGRMMDRSGQTIRGWIKTGFIIAVKIHGRYHVPRSEIKRLFDESDCSHAHKIKNFRRSTI